jgi:hypothetical protein
MPAMDVGSVFRDIRHLEGSSPQTKARSSIGQICSGAALDQFSPTNGSKAMGRPAASAPLI